MRKIIVSACLLGIGCRYDGKSKPVDEVIALGEKYSIVPVCPEILGGLPTPRIPCEIKAGRVINRMGEDKTAEYVRGAEEVLRIARLLNCDTALLKKKSPSCGSGEIYDGGFTGSRATISMLWGCRCADSAKCSKRSGCIFFERKKLS